MIRKYMEQNRLRVLYKFILSIQTKLSEMTSNENKNISFKLIVGPSCTIQWS